MSDNILANKYKFVAGQASPEDVLTAASFPASGSFVDVSSAYRVHVVIRMGAIAGSSAPVFTVQQAPTISGALTDVTGMAHTAADTDDDEMVTFTIDPSKLTDGNEFITVTVSGTVTGSYADIFYMLEENKRPVTQTTALLPSASQYVYA